MRSRVALVLLVAVACVACGATSEKPKASKTTYEMTVAEIKLCRVVWKVGKTLPKDYPGCVEDDGTAVDSSMRQCSPLNEPIHVLGAESYRDLVALLGGTIVEDRERAHVLAGQLAACAASQSKQ